MRLPINVIATTCLLSGALASCSSPGTITHLQTTRTVTTADALVFPPPGGPAVVAVVEKRYRNGIEQDIALRTQSVVPGQNSIRVKFIGPGTVDANTDKTMSSASMTDLSVRSEMRREFPGVAMARSPNFFQNNYGPFGYAVGQTRSGDTCIYGWQQVKSRQDARSALSNLGVIQMRLRLCDSTLPAQALLSTMYSYTINGSFTGWQWNPYGPAGGVDPTLGTPGHPVYPANAAIDHYAPPLGYEPRPVVRRTTQPSRPRPAPVRQAVRAEPAPLVPTGPRVPLPPTNAASANPTTTSSPATTSPAGSSSSNVRIPTPDCATNGNRGACP